MKKGKFTKVAISAAVVCAISLIFSVVFRRPDVTIAEVNRIYVGMTQKEVEAILGCRKGKKIDVPDGATLERITVQVWHGDHGFALVYFGENDVVNGVEWESHTPTLRQKLQRWLPWLPD